MATVIGVSTTIVSDPHEISRVPLKTHANIEESLRIDVLLKAHELLNYKADELKNAGPLGAALQQLDIAPLDTQQVEQYKKSKEGELPNRGNVAESVSHAVRWLGALAFIVGMFRYCMQTIESGMAVGVMIVVSIVFVAMIVFGVIGEVLQDKLLEKVPNAKRTMVWSRYRLGKETIDRWARNPLEGVYPRPIPLHILNHAVQIKALVPAALFEVHELSMVIEQIPRPQPDPFLEVVLGIERYYIDVWDESDFEKQ